MIDEKKFIEPKAEIVNFQNEDIILTSNPLGGEDIDNIPGE